MTDDPTGQYKAPRIPAEDGGPITLALTGAEREIVALALGELLSSVRRDEHLVPAIHALLARLQSPDSPTP